MATLSNSEEDAYYRNDSLKSVESQHRVCQGFGVVLVHSQVAEEKRKPRRGVLKYVGSVRGPGSTWCIT